MKKILRWIIMMLAVITLTACGKDIEELWSINNLEVVGVAGGGSYVDVVTENSDEPVRYYVSDWGQQENIADIYRINQKVGKKLIVDFILDSYGDVTMITLSENRK